MNDKKIFPVINSTLSPGHLADWVAEQYGMESVSCSVLKTNINHTFKIIANDVQYVLRVYNLTYRSYHDIEEEINLLLGLKSVINLSCPIANTAGGYIQEINAPEGKRHIVLFSFAEGKKIRALTTGHNFNIGAAVGSFHHFTRNKSIDRMNYSVDFLVGDTHRELAKYISEDLEEMRFIKATRDVLADAFSSTELTKGIVHLDIWYDNLVVQDDGTITFFDFDNCGNSWLILDIGYYCMQFFYGEPDKEEYERKKEAFLAGYRSKNKLPDNELDLIPYAGLAIFIHYLGVQAKNWNYIANFYLSENYVKLVVARVKDWLKYNGVEVFYK